MGAAAEGAHLELAAVTQLPENTNCLACSEDGRYLCSGHSGGLSVWCASTLVPVAQWLQEKLEITCVQMTRAAESTSLLGTVDDMGVARVLAHHNDVIYLLSEINTMEDINNRSVCVTFELSAGGQYGAAAVQCGAASWLEVYHLPSAAWLKEMETVQAQGQDTKSSEDVDGKWSPVSVITKVTPTGKPLDGHANISPAPDFPTHCLTLDAIRSGGGGGGEWEKPERREDKKIPRRCSHHFLLPSSQFAADFQTGFPAAVAVWWSGARNLLHYLLRNAPKNKSDVDPVPDAVWPNANEILCSAVSPSTRYLALGLGDASVCVWDRLCGAPLATVSVQASNSPFVRVQFVEDWPATAEESTVFTAEKVNLLILCKSGAVHWVTTGRGNQSCARQIAERPKDSRDLPATITSVPFMPSLSLVVQMSGKMFLHDVVRNKTVIFLAPPSTHMIATPRSPVYALNTKRQCLFIRGDRDTSGSASSRDGCQSQLFSFSFGQCEVTQRYVDPPRLNAALTPTTVEEACDHYLRERALSADERNQRIARSWQRLPETATMVHQRQQSVDQLRNCNE